MASYWGFEENILETELYIIKDWFFCLWYIDVSGTDFQSLIHKKIDYLGLGFGD